MNQTPYQNEESVREDPAVAESEDRGVPTQTGAGQSGERYHALRILAFACAMLLCFAIGLLFFLRPETSESEKRELTDFPTFSWETLISGEYFNGISTWYADTFPGREGLIRVNQSIRELFGIRTVQLIQTKPPANTGGNEDLPQGGDQGNDHPIEQLGSVYVKGDTAYEVYLENKANSDRYAELLSLAAQQLAGTAEVYSIAVPLSSSVYLNQAEQKLIGGSDAAAAIASIYAQMEGVHTVDILSTLIEHNDEYLYFRTDHHWTARGAYYAYVCYCRAAGLTPYSLSAWQSYSFEGFLGTLYAEADRPQALGRNPDTVEAWVPNGTNDVVITDKDGTPLRYRGGLVRIDTDKFYAAAASKYNCFLMGDHPLVTIHNEAVSDGSSIVVVKESFGNAFAPFLVDHYEYVYVVDYRYFKNATGHTLASYVRYVGADQVVFINNLTAISASARLNELSALLGVQ